LYFLTSILQFSSSLVFLCALARIHDEKSHIATFAVLVSLMFAGIIAVQQIRGFDGTITEWYVFYLPLLVTQAFIVWRAWAGRRHNLYPLSASVRFTTVDRGIPADADR